MKRFSLSILVVLFLFVAVSSGLTPAAHAANTPPGPGSANPAVQPDGILVPDVFGSTPNWNLTPPLRKFVDTLAPLGCGTPNNLGQCIPIAVPDKRTFPGSDYYEIELRRYTEKVHSDLPNPTTFQGYVQVNNGTNAAGTLNNVAPAPIHYLGPLIITQKGRPVRIKFVNKLPLENVEPFYLPVDRTVMGAGMGPKNADGTNCDPVWDPRGRGLPTTEPNCANYTTNRAELHLHGGLSPWISDGTPHQWITPAGENTPYKKADNVQYVPDMWFTAAGNVIASCAGQLTCGVNNSFINPGDGASTYYYTNDQSARLMFYHDHSYGITRLNVYAGEAAGYLIQDPTELDLITRGIIPADQIPLVIQDKGFVDPATIGTLDPTWVWGTGAALPVKWVDDTGTAIAACAGQATCNVAGARKIIGKAPKGGDLWWPHVYMPAENPSALGGVNPMGRWVYGLYFWPPTTGIKFLPVNNPYYDCGGGDLCNAPWEPPTMPATPNPSWTAEAFVDTPMVNGTVYPKLDVQPKAYRFRILNAAHDRFFNLQLYEADTTVNPNVVNAAACAAMGGCATNTEVKMVPAIPNPAFPLWDAAADQREGGLPDPAKSGPVWIQIGNEGGFLPAPVVIPNQPISYVRDPTLFNVGDVNDGTIILGPAERADVVIDFSQYAGKTLILYNDAPAAFPAFVANNDYYTDGPDVTGSGGHPGPKAGIGPNTRTIMQINVAAAAPAPAFDLNKLMSEFTTTPAQDGVFKKSQEPVIVGQSAYDSAYNLTFPSVAPFWGISNIGDQKISFETLNRTTLAPEVVNSYPMQPKAIHDEMGAVWDEYGRMSAKLGLELPNTTNINQIFVMQNYVDPPTENMQDGKVQLWKITHNGVDTHPIHFHLFDVQVVNRVGWDGFVRLPWPNELGWKETVRISPLEDTIVAMRPKAPPVPFPLLDSMRLKNPVYPNDAAVTDGFMNLDPLTGQAKIPADNNAGLFNFGAEYVWHCHILSHEEQDMMRPLVLRVATGKPADPTGLTVTAGVQNNSLSWTDNAYNGTIVAPATTPNYNMTLGFYIERCNGTCNANNGNFSRIAEMTMISSENPTYIDDRVTPGATYTYRVIGYNRYTTNGTADGSWVNGLTAPAYSAPVVSQSWTPASILTLTPDFASPHDGPIKFIALASGTTVQPQYRFSVNNTVVQNYSVTRYWVMPVGTAAGTYTVKVDARTNYASATPDISQTMSYTLLPTIDTTPPVTTAIPPAGAFLNPVQVYLQANEPGSVIKYTIDGSDPATSATAVIYSVPVSISATTTLKYFATDPAGNPEVVQSGIYELRPANLNATVTINGGAAITNNVAVTLNITATGVTLMRFSNDNITYSADEAYATSKAWTLTPPTPDGAKSVYVRFTDANGILHPPVSSQITLDTTPPVTAPSPAPGTYISTVNVALSADQPGSIIKYTLDGSNPVTSATAATYSGALPISATTAIMYYATDPAGNAGAVSTSIYTIHIADLTINTFNINGGAVVTNSAGVTLTINAVDATGVTKMRFSNDGITYSADEPYATSKAWTLSGGDGVKNVFVQFTDGAGILYSPVATQISLDTTAPITTTIPPAGVFINPVNVYLSANETGSVIKYTIDGSDPATSLTAAIYTGPVNISATTTLKYYATDPAGNAEAVKTGVYQINSATALTSVLINGGTSITNSTAVNLTISATGMAMMRFSNNGVNYSANEPYATSKAWTLDPGDGVKNVFVMFTDGAGTLVGPLIAQITLNTTAPLTTPTPAAGTFLAAVDVTLNASDPNSTIKYTIDGSDPTTSATAVTYSLPIPISTTTTLKYFATNQAGNVETVKSGVYTIHTGLDLTVNNFKINNGAPITKVAAVILTLDAVDPMGVTKMRFSNDGVNYSLDEPYATSKAWTLASGDGVKDVYVRFTDGAGILYAPVAAQITLDATAPVSTVSPAAGTFITPINVIITSSAPSDIIKYTLDGTDPTTSTTALTYTGPVNIAATSTLKHFATDLAGNAEAVKSNVYTFHASDLVASVRINNGATVTNNTAANLTIIATDAAGVVKMRFSSDGVNYSADEAYATTKAWTLGTGDGVKNVFVRFTDGAGILYDPVTAQITLDTTAPVTTTTPAAGTFLSSVFVALTANEANSNIRYTIDGSDPTTSATAIHYNLPINFTADTTTLKYYATDPAGNVEAVKTGIFHIHTADLTVKAFKINGGVTTTNSNAVNLTIDAVDPTGVVKMRFSNDGVNYTADEAYATSKAWTLSSGDGVKNVFARFTDGDGMLYEPVTAQIIVDTSLPVTTASPIPGTYSAAQVTVTLTASKPATIYYTTDGTTPTTASTHYAGPLTVASSSTIKYFAVDAAGNVEPVKTGTWNIHVSDMVSSVLINNGATSTNNTAVTLTLSAVDPLGVDTMQFSNDGITFTPEEPYATSKSWTLSSGDGVKTVYARFRDKAIPTGNLYEPVTASILLSTGPKPDGKITGASTVVLADALRALQIAAGLVSPTSDELVHGDVAPMVNGKSAPDGVIDILDALVILRATLGLVTLQ